MANHTPESLIRSISGDYYLVNDAEIELAKNIVAKLAAVTAQRDELLAAINQILTKIDGRFYLSTNELNVAKILGAAIAKCEAQNDG